VVDTPTKQPMNGRHARTAGTRAGAARRPGPTEGVLVPWVRAQAINVIRHTEALRPFTRAEFGDGAAIPSEAHVRAVNELIGKLREELERRSRRVGTAAAAARKEPTAAALGRFLARKDHAHDSVRYVEKLWDFYLELFGQRQSTYADWLLSCDRIALDCYQPAFLGIGVARSIPSPPPFAYMKTGFSPATFRRGIPLRRLGRQLNPFPLIQLPHHRLVNPWTLGAVLHEVSHNLQNELGLDKAIPRAIARRLLGAGVGRSVAMTWTRWNRETFADLCGLLLGGPAVVGSLMDVVGRSRAATLSYVPGKPHPTPYLRTLLSVELLRRMGFPDEARRYEKAWKALYPDPTSGDIPKPLLRTFETACPLVVDAIAMRPYRELGGKPLAEVVRFAPKEQQMIEEAAGRLAAGADPGVVPARFLIGAARVAMDRKLASPGTIAKNFYTELTRR
jgi:hypothetical protein